MNKLMILVVASMMSSVAFADSSDPLGTGALELGSVDYMSQAQRADFARIDHTDPLGTGAANSDEVWKADISRSVSQPEVGDSDIDGVFNVYETSDVL